MALDKTTVFQEVKILGQRWITGDKRARQAVVKELVDLRHPKGCLYPALVHRYVVKELGFPEGSKFATGLLNEVVE